MAVVYLALGSNTGDSQAYIAKAVRLLSESVSDIVQAPVYRSKAVGYTEQADFFNTALRGDTDLTPRELLLFVKAMEQQLGRMTRFRWGPREIDIDIIFYDKTVVQEPDLTIPHKSFRERDFVLKPICDIDSSFVDPVSGRSVEALLRSLPKSELSIKDTTR